MGPKVHEMYIKHKIIKSVSKVCLLNINLSDKKLEYFFKKFWNSVKTNYIYVYIYIDIFHILTYKVISKIQTLLINF